MTLLMFTRSRVASSFVALVEECSRMQEISLLLVMVAS